MEQTANRNAGERRISPLAGKPAPASILVDLRQLEAAYYERTPDPDDPTQLVSFGTSGHRGSSLRGSFTETHIAAVTQAICEYRRGQGIDGPLYMGKDTHALSHPAQRTALEVLAANGVETVIQREDGVTPTPVISRAILAYNRGRTAHLADGIVITPSHNPPEDGGFKYNPPNGGPADTDVTAWVAAPRQRVAARTARRCEADRVRARARCGDHAPGRSRPAVRARSAARGRHGRDSRRRPHDGRGSARRRVGAVLGADQRALRHADHRRQSRARCHVLVHDGGPRRADPHGPVEPARDGQSRRAEGSLPGGLRQRSGRGPPRDRDAFKRAAEPEPLSGGRDPLPADAPARVAGRRRRRQDARQQQPDRSGRRRRSAAGCWKCRSASSGSCPACSTGRAASAARRAPAPASCAATAPSGPPTRTA